MGWIIAIGLLLLFSGSGSFFCYIFLSEAEAIGPWIATAISMVGMCAIISYIRIKEQWNIVVALCVMGCFGLVQLIILGTIETPPYWEDDGWFVRLCGGFFSQPLFCLIGYGIAEIVEGSFDEKTTNTIRKIQHTLENQVELLEEINHELVQANDGYKRTDNLLPLLSAISDTSLEQMYVEARNEKDEEVLSRVRKILSDNKMNLKLQNKTTSEIRLDTDRMIEEKRTFLSEISKNNYTRKDYGMLKGKLRMISG